MMDKNAVEKFSTNARVKLRKSVDASMARLGIGNGREPESVDSSGTTVVLNLPGGLRTTLTSEQANWRAKLIDRVSSEGYDNVVEQVAYTWFNRLIAIRYMEVNDYLPTHVRVLSSSDKGKIEPDIVTQCIHMADVLNLSSSEKDEIFALKSQGKSDELFSRMFVYECRSLNQILPELFTETRPYEKLLLNLSYTIQDGVVRELVDTIPEDDFKDAVQIIGWSYQYYNSELKNQVFHDLDKKIKFDKDRIPAATQLFTPDWIVRYMVENSLGRVWLEGHPDLSLQSKWKYYLEEADQEPQVKEKLKEIRSSRRRMEPTDIKVIDPCMGSGHVLVYAFDVLIQIYESYGYSKQDAASLIVENNLFGLDIDERAYQLAYFAVMMKARSYDPNIFNRKLKPNISAIIETAGMDESCLEGYGNGMAPMEKSLAYNDMRYLISLFKDARTYGSLIKVRELDFKRINAFINARSINLYSDDDSVKKIVAVSSILSQKYDAVVTNPPYLASSGMDAKLSKYVKDCYPNSKSDLFACFIDRCMSMAADNSFTSMITQHSFMFLSSFEDLRHSILKYKTILNMAHQGARGFDQIGGEVVQTTAFTIYSNSISDYIGTYCRLVDDVGESAKESRFLSGENRFHVKQSRFNSIPGSPISYWLSDKIISCFGRGIPLSEIATPRVGLQTGENARFVRLWFEVSIDDVSFDCQSRSDSIKSGKQWFPYNKGGDYRKWYGNNDTVVDWSNDGDEIRNFKDEKGKLRSRPQNMDYYFKQSITWSKVSSGAIAFRYKPAGHIFDVAGTSIFADESIRRYIHGFCNSCVASAIANAISPTLNYEVGHIASFPIITSTDTSEIDRLVQDNIDISKEEWDSFETSWDFKTNPLINYCEDGLISKSYSAYSERINQMFSRMKANEERLNEIFIEIYGLEGELSAHVDDSRITIRSVSPHDAISHLMSYAVGCIFGRYSLKTPGIHFAGGEWAYDPSDSLSDADNIVPINDNEYFGDDIVVRIVEFIKVAFGKEHLEDNLKFIADNLGIKYTGTARDGIRKYFLNNFYDDHVNMYQKCPIYWLFDSGKENGFKALIYMHRYTPDLIAKMRQDYLLPMLSRYTEQLKTAEGTMRIELQKKIEEIQVYDIAVEKYASEKVSIDLNDGVKVNYAKFQNIDNPGSKKKINLLHPLK